MSVKQGPLARDELLSIWSAVVDKSFRDPLIKAGEGHGLEAYTQMMEQFARVSRAIDTSTQAMFIRPHSAQTADPAAGEAKATVTLTFQRSKLLDRPLVLQKGLIFVDEQQTDFGVDGGEEVLTGRRYVLTDTLVFHPGDKGPFTTGAIAELPGWGYNNPLPGTLRVIDQPGTNFFHTLASVLLTSASPAPPSIPGISSQVFLQTVNEADTFVPEHIGQYVFFVSGSNAGKIARVVSFTPPDPSVPVGSTVQLENLGTFEATTFAGTFTPGETVTFDSGGPVLAYGKLIAERVVGGKKRVAFVVLSGNPFTATSAVGASSGATATVALTQPVGGGFGGQFFVAETGVVEWRVLDWALDWGLTVTNVSSPVGGRLGFLDALGAERRIARAPGETDESYRERVGEIADVVSPNAIRRTLNRTMGAYAWCFREVGSAALPGFFYDGDRSGPHVTPGGAINDAYDTDTLLFTGVITSGTFIFQERVQLEDTSNNAIATGFHGRIDGGVTYTFIRKSGSAQVGGGIRIRGLESGAIFTPSAIIANPTVDARRFRETFDYTEFRAFFLIGVPALGAGDFGFAYDAGPHDAYDAAPYTAFYDGFPATAAQFYRRIYQAIDRVRAGGVGFQLYQEKIGCP